MLIEGTHTGDKEAYQKFFNGMLKKFGVKSASELDDKKKKEFYNAIDAGWEGDDEVEEDCGYDHETGKKLKKVKKEETEFRMKTFKEIRETIKKGDVFTKKEALKYFKKERKDFKPSELKKFKNKGGIVVMHWQDGETGEVVPMKEAKQRGFIVVHAKKGKLEVYASSSYEAAKKAASKWKLKSTSGIDAHLAD